MLKQLFLVFLLGWSFQAAAEYDNFQSNLGGNGPAAEVTTITITVILSPTFEETTRICETSTPAAGCNYEDTNGNQVIVIPSAEGWDDFYSLCIAGHELYHAIGANHARGIGCPYPYISEDNVAKGTGPNTDKKEETKSNKTKKKNKK